MIQLAYFLLLQVLTQFRRVGLWDISGLLIFILFDSSVGLVQLALKLQASYILCNLFVFGLWTFILFTYHRPLAEIIPNANCFNRLTVWFHTSLGENAIRLYIFILSKLLVTIFNTFISNQKSLVFGYRLFK